MATMRVVLMLVAMTACVSMHSTSALIHVVGGTDGWRIPPNATFYEEWAKPRTFGVGDKIVFPYRVGAHNVLQVSKTDFETCGNDHVIDQFYKGPTVFQLNATGDYYFYSGIGTHCELGQKLHVSVINGPGSSGRSFGGDGGDDLAEGPAGPAPVASTPGPDNSAPANVAQLLGVVSSFVLAVLFM